MGGVEPVEAEVVGLPKRITKTDAAHVLGITRVTLDKRIADGVHAWPPKGWPELVAELVAYEKADRVIDHDDARFRRARADNHEIEAAKKRGAFAPIAEFEEQIVEVFGLFVQELDGAAAQLQRLAGRTPIADAISKEFRAIRENLARGVDRYSQRLEERARRGDTGADAGRRRVGARREGAPAG